MKKIGFIDHYLNNFHSDIYTKLIREGRFEDEFDVAYAYGDASWDGMSSEQWCENNGVEFLSSPEEVVEKSNYLIVLSPNNPELHMKLCTPALTSGKRTYVDKTFAPDLKIAKELIRMAEEHNTPMYTTSALRYVPEIHEYRNGVGRLRETEAVVVRGPSSFAIYAVHVIEPLVMLLGHGAEAVSYFGNGRYVNFNVKYPDHRFGGFQLFEPCGSINDKYYGHPFNASVMVEDGATQFTFSCDDMFKDAADSMCEFFTGAPAVAPVADTLEVMALIETSRKAMDVPGTWVSVVK